MEWGPEAIIKKDAIIREIALSDPSGKTRLKVQAEWVERAHFTFPPKAKKERRVEKEFPGIKYGTGV